MGTEESIGRRLVTRVSTPRESLLAGCFAVVLATWSTYPGALGQSLEKAHLTVRTESQTHAAGGTARFSARVIIDPGWHTNSNTPTLPYLIPTEVRLELPEGWTSGAVSYPEGEMRAFAFARDRLLSVYEGAVVITGEIGIPEAAGGKTGSVKATLRYQACNDKICLPPTTASDTLVVTVAP